MSQRQPKNYLRKNKISGQFSARTIAMMESPAFQVLSLSAHRVLHRLEIEHAHHGGNDNGELPVTYDQFIEYGIHRNAVSPAIREVEALGFVEITERGRAGNAEWRRPNKFRLTYRQVGRAAATDEWLNIKTTKEAEVLAQNARKASKQNHSPVSEKDNFHPRNRYRKRGFHTPETDTTEHTPETDTTSISRNLRAKYGGKGSRRYTLSADPRASEQYDGRTSAFHAGPASFTAARGTFAAAQQAAAFVAGRQVDRTRK
jgi:hypothetical protein